MMLKIKLPVNICHIPSVNNYVILRFQKRLSLRGTKSRSNLLRIPNLSAEGGFLSPGAPQQSVFNIPILLCASSFSIRYRFLNKLCRLGLSNDFYCYPYLSTEYQYLQQQILHLFLPRSRFF
jgi:hypothetical protein